MKAGSLTYDTKLDTKSFEKGLDKINTKSVAVGNLLADAFKGVAKAMAEVVKQGISYNAQMETYETQLKTLTGSAEEADKVLTKIKDDAKKTPFDVSGLVQGQSLLMSTGLSAEKAREDILNLGNAISATGGGNDELSRMAVNLQQIKNVGKASALDIKQFAYAGIDIYGLLADALGVTRDKATELDVTYEQLTEALKYASQEGGKYFGAMEAQSKTFAGQMSNLKESFQLFFGEVAKPVFDFLRDSFIPTLNGLFDGTITLEDGITNLINTIIEKGLELFNKIVEKLPEIIPKIIELLENIVNTLIEHLPDMISAGIDLILALALGIVEAIPQLLEKLPEIISKIVSTLTKPEMLAKIIKAALQLILALGEGLIKAIPDLLLMIPEIIIKTKDELLKNIKETDWKSLGKNILDGLLNGITNFGKSVKESISKVGKKIKNEFKSFFGIHSPSKVMEKEIGQYLPKGIAIGIEANTDSALNSIDKMNDEIMNKMTRAVAQEQAVASFKGTSGSVSEILNANSIIKVENFNTLELDGEKVYENQNKVQQRKNLQYGFGGGTSK